MKKCSVPSCERISYGLGYCSAHYQRFSRNGSVNQTRPLSRINKGPTNGNWNGGTVTEKSGRVLVYAPDHPHTIRNIYVYRYRLAMERHIGRYLDPSEIVHHKNGICNDDRIENLEITTRSKHTTNHIKERIAGKWAFKHSHCAKCGTIEIRHKARGMCKMCYMKRIRRLIKLRKGR